MESSASALRSSSSMAAVLAVTAGTSRQGTARLMARGLPGGFVPGSLRLFRALLDLADVQLPHAERHDHDARRDEPSGRVEPSPAPIRAHSSSVRVLSASASARSGYCRLLPARYPVPGGILADQVEVTSCARRRRAVQPAASVAWQ